MEQYGFAHLNGTKCVVLNDQKDENGCITIHIFESDNKDRQSGIPPHNVKKVRNELTKNFDSSGKPITVITLSHADPDFEK